MVTWKIIGASEASVIYIYIYIDEYATDKKGSGQGRFRQNIAF